MKIGGSTVAFRRLPVEIHNEALRKIGYNRACVIELEGELSPAEADEQLRRARGHIEQAFAPPEKPGA